MEDKTPTGKDLRQWRTTVLRMTRKDLGQALGLTESGVKKMELAEEREIPLRTRLACASLRLGMSDYDLGGYIGLELGRVASPGLRR